MPTLQRPSADLGPVPDAVRAELAERSRISAVTVVAVTALAFPGWAVLDRVLEPALAAPFLAARVLTEVPILACLWLLWRHPVGRRHPAALSFLALALVQACTAGMLVRVDHLEFYLLGFSLALHGSGVLLVVRPRWTVALVTTSAAVLAVNVFTDPTPLNGRLLTALLVFFGTTSLVALMAHHRRAQLAAHELRTRLRLADEQRRTAELLARLEQLSNEDPLTGLANRRRWDAALADSCAGPDGGRRPAVVLIDLDRFKQVNDRFGHQAGDAALVAVADLLRERVRAGDLVARLGGDELAVLLPDADLASAVAFAERVRAESLGLWPEGYDEPGVSLSLGVAVAAGPGAQPRDLLGRADAQLYRPRPAGTPSGRRSPASAELHAPGAGQAVALFCEMPRSTSAGRCCSPA